MQREFMEGVWREMEGNVVLAVATGRNDRGKLVVDEYHWFKYPEEIDLAVEFAEEERKGDRRNTYFSPMIYGDKPLTVRDKATGKWVEHPTDRNGRPQYSRGKDNALWAQTVFMDSDSCPPEAFRIKPSLHMNSSSMNGQDYWFLDEPVPAAEAAEVAHKITTAHEPDGCDPSGWSQNKVLRLPTWNTKYDQKNPYQINFHVSGEIYALADVAGAYDDVELHVRASDSAADGQHFEYVVPKLDELPDFGDLVAKIPSTERRLNDLIYKEPRLGETGWRSKQRWGLILDLIRFGFSEIETASVVWHSPAGRKWHEDPRELDGVMMEIAKAQAIIHFEQTGEETGTEVTPATPTPADQVEIDQKPLKVLTGPERKMFEERWDFSREYSEWGKTRVQTMNRPLWRANSIMLQSIIFSTVGVIPQALGRMFCNLYMIPVAESSSGKTEALYPMDGVLNAYFSHEDHPDLGGEHSKSALISSLLERANKISLIRNDEADGHFAEIKIGAGGTMGLLPTYTKVYDGVIPQQNFKNMTGERVVGAKAPVCSYMMGTPAAILGSLDRDYFLSGYLARNIWIIGEQIPVTRESVKTQRPGADRDSFYSSMPNYWASVFRSKAARVLSKARSGHRWTDIDLTDEAVERFDDAKWQITEHFMGMGDPEVFRTSIRRMSDVIHKVAALEAMWEGLNYITERHMVYALGYAEEWLHNLVYIAANIANSAFSKACDEIEQFIAGREGREAEASAVYRFRRGESVYDTDRYIDSLMKQRRIIERPTGAGKARYLKIKEKASHAE